MTSSKQPSPFRMYKGDTRLPFVVAEGTVEALESFDIREDDVLLVSYPKSGTHWMNELIYLLLVDGNVDKLDHRHRSGPLEITDVIDLGKIGSKDPSFKIAHTLPSPRVLKSHLRPRYLPKQVWDKQIPIINVLRNPKDACLSMFDFACTFILPNGEPYMKREDFEDFLENFVSGEIPFDGWCEHIMSFENIENTSNILFVTYEDMHKDLSAVVKRVATHLGRGVTGEIIQQIVENCQFDEMKKNYAVAMKTSEQDASNLDKVSLFTYLHKGIAGRWDTGTEFAQDQWKRLDEQFAKTVKNSKYARQYFVYD